MAGLTLIEASKLAANNGEDERAGVIALYAEQSDILAAMSFQGISGNAFAITQEGDLPSTAFRGVNEAYTAGAGTINKQKFALMIAGGDVDVDNFLIQTEGEAVRAKHVAMKVKSQSATITDAIITGDNTTEPRKFDGLQALLTGDQLIDAGSTSGGDALSLAKLDQLIDTVDSATHLIMSRDMRRLFVAAARSPTITNNLVTMDMDSDLGRRVTRYADIPILVGYPRNKNTSILPFTEANPGGGSAASTSIYAVNFDGDAGLIGIENGGVQVRDLGEVQDAPVKRTRIEWYVSIVPQSPFCAARLRGIKNAAITA